jgi:adenylate cyclase class 2
VAASDGRNLPRVRNIEYKAELRDPALARTILTGLGATFILSFGQEDTYFRIPDGRLKRRQTDDEPPEWIFYSRPNVSGPKVSDFTILDERRARERFGAEPLPVWVVVRKRRDLWMMGTVRIHLDDVEGLGWFLELESLVTRDMPDAKAREALDRLRVALAPALGEPIDRSYSDLIAAERDHAER